MKPTFQISEDEIIRDWSLNPVDISFVRKFKKQYHLWIYLQICALKLLGQLLENPNNLNSRIIGHACKTLGLAIIGTVKIPSRDATRTEYKKQIFEYLHFKPFNETKSVFQCWLTNRVKAGIIVAEQLIPKAEAFLDVTWFQKFKEYPASASITMLQDYLNRYKKLAEIDLSSVNLMDISPELSKHLYQLIRYYNAYKMNEKKRRICQKSQLLVITQLNGRNNVSRQH